MFVRLTSILDNLTRAGKQLELVFCVDNTASMTDHIKTVAESLQSVVTELSSALQDVYLSVGVVTYGDHPNSAPFFETSAGSVTVHFQL